MAILPSFKRRPSTTSSVKVDYEAPSPSLRSSSRGGGEIPSTFAQGGGPTGVVMASFALLKDKLPTKPKLPAVSPRSDAKISRGMHTFVKLSESNLSDVVQPLVHQLRELLKTSDYQVDDLSLTLTLQTQLLILDILSAIFPPAPSRPSDVPEPFPTTLPLEEPSLSLLLEALSIIISTSSSFSNFSSILNENGMQHLRNSEDSGRGSVAGRSNTHSRKQQPQQYTGRHQNSSSRSGPFSPTSSSNSLPQDGFGTSIRNGESGSSEQQRSSNCSSGATAPAFETLVRRRASELMRVLSFFRWDVVWSSIRTKLQNLASESLDDTGLSETCLQACFMDRPRLVQVLSELSPIFIHLSRPAQISVSDALYRAIWSWIRYSPADFVQLYRKGQRLEGDPASLFDVCYNAVPDTDKKSHTFWPVMAMLMALCPDMIVRVLELSQTSHNKTVGKKVQFFESIHSAFYSTKIANAAKRCGLDLVELASLLPSDIEHTGLLIWVSDFAGDLQETLLGGKETPDADLISDGLEHFYRRDPDSLSRTLPKLITSFDKMCLARACTKLAQTTFPSTTPLSVELISSVGNLLADYVISLKSTSQTIADSATTTGSLRDLRQPDIDLLLSILQLYSTDIRFLVSFHDSDKVAILLNLLSSMLCDPAPEIVRTAASAAFKSVYRQAGRTEEGSQKLELSQEVYEYLGSTSWRSAGNAAHQVLNLGIDDASSKEDIEVLADTFTLACKFAATYLQAHASSTTIREGLAMHEVALTLAILSPDEGVVAAAVEAFKRRESNLTHLVVSILGSTISDSSPGLELLDAQKTWQEDTEALFPSGSDGARLTFAAMSKVLSSRPAASRAHAFAFKLLFERWERTLISIRAGATATESKEFVEWSHLGSVLCVLGQSCLNVVDLRDGPSRPDLLTVELLEEFVQGLCDCLVQKELALRSSVETELSQLGPGLLEMLLHSLLKTSRDIFRRLPTPTLQDLGTTFVSHALVILIATVPALTTPISSDPGPLLATLTQRLDRNLATLAGIPSESTTVDGVTTVVSSLQRACQLCEIVISKRDLFNWSALPLLRNELLDRMSNWTTWNLTINPIQLPTAFVELDYSCISTAATLAEGLKLQAGYRVGGSRKRLFESWFALLHHHLLQALRSKPLALTTRESSLSRNLPDFPTAIGITLSNLLDNNGDVAFDRCIAMTYSSDLAVRAVYTKVVGEATRKLVVKEKRNRFEMESRHPLLGILVEPGMLLLPILTDIYSRVDHDTVSDLVLRRFEKQDAGFDLLKALVEIEISQTTQEAEIFRGTTLCTKVYSQFARRHARNYLRNLLRPFVQAIIDDNPAYGASSTVRNDAPQSSSAIESLAQTLLDRLCSSLSRVPHHLRAACRILGETVSERFPGMGRRAVGSFVILRIISPSIVSPAWMQLDLDGLNHSGRRALVDVSKLVTNLANDVVLGQKESHMGEFQGFRSPANIQAMERFLDGLQIPDSSPPSSSPSISSTSDEDDADELFLRLMLKEHASTVDDYLGSHPRREEVRKLFTPSTPSGSETAIDFMTRTRARKLHSEGFDDVFRDVSSQGKSVFVVDCGRLEFVDLDRLMRYALDLLQDAPAGWSVVFDCTGINNLDGLSVAWILEALKLLETLKTLWEGGSSRCRKIIVYGANSLTLVLFQRVSSLLAVSNGTRALREIVGLNSTAALAAFLDIDPEHFDFLTAVPTQEEALFFDPSAELIDLHRTRISTSITLGPDSITLLRSNTRLILGPQGGSTIVQDTRRLNDLRDLSVTDDNGTRVLRLRFKTGDPLDLVTDGQPQLEMMISANLSNPAPRTKAAAPDMTAVRVTLSGLLNLVAMKSEVRSAALGVLATVSDAGPLQLPALPTLEGLAHPRTAHSMVLKTANEITALNPEYSIALIREGCLAFSLVQDPFQQRLLLDFFGAWIHNLSAFLASTPPKTDHSKISVVLRDLLSITVAHHGSLRSEFADIWAKVGSFDPALGDAAAHEAIAKAAFSEPASDRLDIVAEVILSLASHSLVGTFLSFVLQLVEGSPPTALRHPWTKQIASLATVSEKLSHSPQYTDILLPDLIHVSLLSLWTVDEPYLPLVHGTIINILRSLSSSSSTTDRALADLAQALQQDQRRRTQRHRSPLQTPESLITEALSKELVCTCTLDAMLIAAKNTDQANVWRTRWLTLAVSSALKSSVPTRPAALAILKVLVEECGVDSSSLYCHMLDAFGRMLTDHSDDEAGVIAILRFLTGLVNQLSTDSVLASFWIGIAVLQISPVHFVVALDLVNVSLRTMLFRGIYPSSTDLVEALIPNGNFFLSNVDADWEVNLEGSLALSIIILLFKGLHLPLARKSTNDVLFQLFEVLLRSETLSTVEELAFGHTLASVPSNLPRIKALYSDVGLPRSSSWENLPLPANDEVTVVLLAFVAGPLLASTSDKVKPYGLLARASHEAPKMLDLCRDLLLPELSQTIAISDDEELLLLADILLSRTLYSHRSSSHNLAEELESRGLQSLLTCHTFTPVKIEHFRRLLVVASEIVRVEVCRLEDASSEDGENTR